MTDLTHDELTAEVVATINWLRFWFDQAHYRVADWEPRPCPPGWQ